MSLPASRSRRKDRLDRFPPRRSNQAVRSTVRRRATRQSVPWVRARVVLSPARAFGARTPAPSSSARYCADSSRDAEPNVHLSPAELCFLHGEPLVAFTDQPAHRRDDCGGPLVFRKSRRRFVDQLLRLLPVVGGDGDPHRLQRIACVELQHAPRDELVARHRLPLRDANDRQRGQCGHQEERRAVLRRRLDRHGDRQRDGLPAGRLLRRDFELEQRPRFGSEREVGQPPGERFAFDLLVVVAKLDADACRRVDLQHQPARAEAGQQREFGGERLRQVGGRLPVVRVAAAGAGHRQHQRFVEVVPESVGRRRDPALARASCTGRRLSRESVSPALAQPSESRMTR